jgi:hypothetical protein
MTYIDWSDAEDMFGLLVDFVHDARSETADRGRRSFLSRLMADIEALREQFEKLPGAEIASRLREIQNSLDGEFADDPVVMHLKECADELERVEGSVRNDIQKH